MIVAREPSPKQNSNEIIKSDTKKSPTSSPRTLPRNSKKTKSSEHLSFFGDNMFKIANDIIIIIALASILIFYLRLRIDKQKDIQDINSNEKLLYWQNKFNENKCSDALKENKPPMLVKICNNFQKNIDEHQNKKSVSELSVEYVGSLVQIFFDELEKKTMLSIFFIFAVIILIETLRNRPKLAL